MRQGRGKRPTTPKPSAGLPEFRVVSLHDEALAAHEIEWALNQGYTLTQKFVEFVVLRRMEPTPAEPQAHPVETRSGADIVSQAKELAAESQRLQAKTPFDA